MGHLCFSTLSLIISNMTLWENYPQCWAHRPKESSPLKPSTTCCPMKQLSNSNFLDPKDSYMVIVISTHHEIQLADLKQHHCPQKPLSLPVSTLCHQIQPQLLCFTPRQQQWTSGSQMREGRTATRVVRNANNVSEWKKIKEWWGNQTELKIKGITEEWED